LTMPPKAFLITPFSPERAGNEDPRIFHQVQVAVAAAARATGVELIHPAEMREPGRIMEHVRQEIEEADVILAIVTGKNENVFTEVGMAMEIAQRWPILIVSSMDELPFDVRQFRFLTYGGEGELGQLTEQLVTAIHASLASQPRRALGPQPVLDSRTIATGERAVLNFRSRAVPLIGREAEMGQLKSFLQAPIKFLWQLLNGLGGAGKSRLALELCLVVKETWSAGFLPASNGFEDKWIDWRPARPTLIVIDEVEVRQQEAKAILEALSLRQDKLAYPVRLLLIGRERQRQLESVLAIDPYEWEALYSTSAFGAPLTLGPLKESHAAEIAAQVSKLAYPTETLFKDDPRLRLPLFASLTGIAMSASGQALRWDHTTVTRFVLERDKSQHWHGSTAEDENLLAYLSITGSQPLNFLLNPPAEKLFPANPETALERNQRMADHDGPDLMPLKPGPLGELFVLDLLARAKITDATLDRGNQVVDAAMRIPIVSADFVVRTSAHFPSHPGIARLWAAMIPHFDAYSGGVLPWGVPILMDSIRDFVHSGDIAQAKAITTAARILEQRSYPDMFIWGGSGEASFNLVTALAEVGAFEEARQAINELEAVASDREEAVDPFGRALGNAIYEASHQTQTEVVWSLIERFKELTRKMPALKKYYFHALIDGVKAAPTIMQAEGLFQSSLKMFQKAPDNAELGEKIAGVAFNLTNYAQREGQGAAALRTFEAVLDLEERLSPGVVSPEFVAKAMIPTGAAIAAVGAQDAARFTQRVEAFASTHLQEPKIRKTCVNGLYNVIITLGPIAEPESQQNALRAFEALCRVATCEPRLSGATNDCLTAAARLRLAFQDPEGEQAMQLREILRHYAPEALEPGFLSSCEEKWGTDLSFFR
jgi:hypothetical protein